MSTRRNSLRLQVSATPPPIPPSLKKSPYLHAPVFTRPRSTSYGPSDVHEQWLQDTVPLDHSHSHYLSPSSSSPTALNKPPIRAPIALPNMNRDNPHTSGALSTSGSSGMRYLAHSLAPPQIDRGSTPCLLSPSGPRLLTLRPTQLSQARSAPNLQHYFPRLSPSAR